MIDDPSELLEQFNTHFSKIADKLREKLPDSNIDLSRLTNFVNSRKDHDVVFTPRDVTVTQVISILKRVSANKSVGINGISAKFTSFGCTSYHAEYCKDNRLLILNNWKFSSPLETA